MQDDLGDRMKTNYEGAFSHYLPHHMPVIIRLDGKLFHNLTKRANKPFDHDLVDLMRRTTLHLCQEIDTVKLGYSQSDEISLLLHPYQKLNSQPWLGNNIQKIVSISAAMATAAFNGAAEEFRYSRERFTPKFGDKLPALFDARSFVVPECEIVNSFIWRQKDAIRNNISMHAQSIFSHKELDKKSSKDKIEMMKQKGIDHYSLPVHLQRGFCVLKKDVETNGTIIRQKWVIDNEIPVFTENRKYIKNAFFGEKDEHQK